MKSQFVLVYFFLFCLHSAVSQNRWIHSAGGAASDEALDIDLRDNDGYYIGGYFSSSSDFNGTTLQSAGLSDCYIQAVDENGLSDWVTSFGGAGSDRVRAICTHPDGGVVAAGLFVNSMNVGSLTLTSTGDSLQIFIVRLDANGTVMWAEQCGGIYDDLLEDVTVDDLGNIFITGAFRGESSFGSTTFESTPYQGSSEYSYDLFLSKLSSDGDFIWTQTGSSDYDNRGMAVATDQNGRSYMAALIGDTITFDVTHNNDILAANVLVSFDPQGTEQWALFYSATQSIPYDIELNNAGNIHVIGDHTGTMAIQSNPIEYISSSYANNVHLLEISANGDFLNSTGIGSANRISGRAFTYGNANEIYATGTFSCQLTEMTDAEGNGIYRSIGYNDVWVARFESSGERSWLRHFGGQGDDFCKGIAYNSPDRPVLAGSYSGMFHVPTDGSLLNNQNPFGNTASSPSAGVSYCGDSPYGDWESIGAFVNSETAKEIFLIDGVLLNKGPLDYFKRYASVPCEFDAWAPCISSNSNISPWECPDSLFHCDQMALQVRTFKEGPSGNNYYVPKLNYQWSTGSQQSNINVYQSGTYSCTISREDNCDSWESEIVFMESGSPPNPLISDALGVNIEAQFTSPLSLCDDSVNIWGSEICNGCNGYWSGSGNMDSSLIVTNSGSYTFNVVDSAGCQSENSIYIDIDTLITINQVPPSLFIYHDGLLITDTLMMCPNEFLELELMPLTSIQPDVSYLPSYTYSIDGSAPQSIFPVGWDASFSPTISGTYVFYSAPSISILSACQDTTINFPELSDTVYIEVFDPAPVNLSYSFEEPTLCPGDTLLMVLSGADTYSLTADFNIVDWISDDSLLINEPGQFILTGYSSSLNGCSESQTLSNSLEFTPTPVALTIPDPGVVCPGDMVTLYSNIIGEHHQWVGSLGNLIDTTASIDVNTSGQYFVIVEDSYGCVLESNTAETFNYATPFLNGITDSVICMSENMVIEVVTTVGATIEWLQPTDGSQPYVEVFKPGIYSVTSTLCDITVELSVEVLPSEQGDITIFPSDSICEGEDVNIMMVQDFLFNHEWTSPQGLVTESESLFLDSPTLSDEGIYSIIAADKNGCLYESETYLTVIDQPSLTLDSTSIFCEQGYMYLSSPDFYDSYLWNNGSSQPEISVSEPGMYSLEVTMAGFCTDIDSLFISDITCISEMVNVFSPNGDGMNDQIDFGILGIPIERIEIYNRWGKLVRTISSVNLIWDGIADNGKAVSEGTYFWRAYSAFQPSRGLNKSGWVQVFR